MRAEKYRLRCNRKRLSLRSSPHRDKQFKYINEVRDKFEHLGLPVISVDAKKRELIGLFRNPGCTWRTHPRDVNMYDFPSDAIGVGIPYGIYDVTRGDGFVVVGTSHNTPAFAAHSVGMWWQVCGREAYPNARRLLVLADSGSSNGRRAVAWKQGLQDLATRARIQITVAHYPTGASKWNPVEHRLFSAISQNWAGEPLTDYGTICGFIRNTRTRSQRRCRVRLDRRHWPTQKELRKTGKTPPKCSVIVHRADTLPEMNYTIKPASSRGQPPS